MQCDSVLNKRTVGLIIQSWGADAVTLVVKYMHSMRCCASIAGLQTGKTHAGNANMMMATAAAIMLLAAAVTYELPHLVS